MKPKRLEGIGEPRRHREQTSHSEREDLDHDSKFTGALAARRESASFRHPALPPSGCARQFRLISALHFLLE
jgi:hypothetical protein